MLQSAQDCVLSRSDIACIMPSYNTHKIHSGLMTRNRTASKSGYPDAHGTDPGVVCSLPLHDISDKHAAMLAA
jgi:hypothetical protein